jgi:hypothetical protein
VSANFRFISTFEKDAKDFWILDTGISGNPFSENYDD